MYRNTDTGEIIDDKSYRKKKDKELWLRVKGIDLLKDDLLKGQLIHHYGGNNDTMSQM